MDTYRFYEVTATLPGSQLLGRFAEAAGALQPVAGPTVAPLLDAWTITDDISGVLIRVGIHGEAGARRMLPASSDPAWRLARLFGALACFRAGLIAHGLEKAHYFLHADALETSVAAELLTANERQNVFLEAYLGSWQRFQLPQLSRLAAIAGIDQQASEEELRRTIRDWYAKANAWSTRIAGFAHQAEHFLRVENGVEQSKLAAGDECRFAREPYNRADANAVMVIHQSGRKLGYLRRTIAEYVAPLLDLGALFRAKVAAFLTDEFRPDERVFLTVERLG